MHVSICIFFSFWCQNVHAIRVVNKIMIIIIIVIVIIIILMIFIIIIIIINIIIIIAQFLCI